MRRLASLVLLTAVGACALARPDYHAVFDGTGGRWPSLRYRGDRQRLMALQTPRGGVTISRRSGVNSRRRLTNCERRLDVVEFVDVAKAIGLAPVAILSETL